MSGRQDSNLRPPAPKAGAIAGLRYAPFLLFQNKNNTYYLPIISIWKIEWQIYLSNSEKKSNFYRTNSEIKINLKAA